MFYNYYGKCPNYRKCPDNTIGYVIKPGDTLYSISMGNNVTIKDILKANPFLNPYNLIVGQKICIPVEDICCPYGQIYVVKDDDTYLKIAKKFDISYAELAKVNEGFDPYNIRPGQKLCIPVKELEYECPTGNTYIVKKGDTLDSIAKKYDVKPIEILLYNPKISPNEITTGVELCVPPKLEF